MRLMRIIARKTLQDFWQADHTDVEQPLRAWFNEVSKLEWCGMAELKARHAHAAPQDEEQR